MDRIFQVRFSTSFLRGTHTEKFMNLVSEKLCQLFNINGVPFYRDFEYSFSWNFFFTTLNFRLERLSFYMRSMHDQQWKSRMLKLSACFYTSLCGCPLTLPGSQQRNPCLVVYSWNSAIMGHNLWLQRTFFRVLTRLDVLVCPNNTLLSSDYVFDWELKRNSVIRKLKFTYTKKVTLEMLKGEVVIIRLIF